MSVETRIIEIPANELIVDPNVQRKLDVNRARKIADKWDSLMVGVLTVSDRGNGQKIVLDGQTRLAALRMVCGPETATSLMCQVYTGLSRQEEAAMFLDHNDRKAVGARDRFRLALVAQEKWAEDIRNIAERYDWAPVGIESGAKYHFTAITAAEKIYRLDNGEALNKAFGSIAITWNGHGDAVLTETLYGFGLLYARHPQVNCGEFAKKLRRVALGEFLGNVAMERKRGRTSVAQAAYVHAVDLYNYRRSAHRIEL